MDAAEAHSVNFDHRVRLPGWGRPVIIGRHKPFKLHGTCAHKIYRLTCEEFERLLVRANRSCEGCGATGGRLHIDHDHKTQYVRGILCPKCNAQIALMDIGAKPFTEAFQRYLNLPWIW